MTLNEGKRLAGAMNALSLSKRQCKIASKRLNKSFGHLVWEEVHDEKEWDNLGTIEKLYKYTITVKEK